MRRGRARRHRLDLAGEFRLRHRLSVADAAADALAPRHGAGDGRRQGGARRGRHGGEHHPRQVAARHRDRGVARVPFDAMDVLADALAQAWAGRGAHRHRDGLSAGRRFRRAAASCCRRRDFTAGAGAAGAPAPDQDAAGDRHPAQAVAHRRPRHHRRLSLGAGRRQRDGPRRRADARRLRAGRRIFQADDRGDRRAQRVSQCRPDRARAQARRCLPGRDLPDDRRLSRRACAAPPRSARRRRRPSASGPISPRASISCSTPSSRAPRAARSTSSISSKVGELDLPPISFIGHGIGLHLHEDPYLGPTDDRRSRPAWCSASSP